MKTVKVGELWSLNLKADNVDEDNKCFENVIIEKIVPLKSVTIRKFFTKHEMEISIEELFDKYDKHPCNDYPTAYSESQLEMDADISTGEVR